MSKDKNTSKKTWALIGFGAAAIGVGVFVIATGGTGIIVVGVEGVIVAGGAAATAMAAAKG